MASLRRKKFYNIGRSVVALQPAAVSPERDAVQHRPSQRGQQARQPGANVIKLFTAVIYEFS